MELLAPSGQSRKQRDRAVRYAEFTGEKTLEMLVCLAFNGCDGDSDFQCAVVNSDDGIVAGSRLHVHIENHVSAVASRAGTHRLVQRNSPGNGTRKLTNCSRMMTSSGDRSMPPSEGRIFCTGRSNGAFSV